MLPQITLDDEQFEEILETCRKQIAGLYPDWTDYNYHDPGITIMELFAWLKEMQQFHLDQTGDRHIQKYLKLMGDIPLQKRPAEAEIYVEGLAASVFFPEKSRFYAGDICFETIRAAYMDAAVVRKVVCGYGDRALHMDAAVNRNKMRFPVFGPAPQPGDFFGIGFDRPLEIGKKHNLCLHFFHDAKAVRNPIGGDTSFIPLAEIGLSYTGSDGSRKADLCEDTTHQLLEDGFLLFCVDEKMERGAEGLYWIRLTLKSGSYDIPPIIEGISLHQLQTIQKKTVAEYCDGVLEEKRCICQNTCLARNGEFFLLVKGEGGYYPYLGHGEKTVEEDRTVFSFPELKAETRCRLVCFDSEYGNSLLLGEGNGLPFGEIVSRIPELCSNGLAVMAETGEGSGCFLPWENCMDFAESVPGDRHYHFDENTGVFAFGDCDHGMAPEGRVLLVGGCTSLGRGGNVKALSISRPEEAVSCNGIWNERDAEGGRDMESLMECRGRGIKNRRQAVGAVTYQDYETIAKGTPGLVINTVKAVPLTRRQRQDGTVEECTVALAVKPYSQKKTPGLTEAYKKNIQKELEHRRMLGTQVEVLAPEYIGISIFAEVETRDYDNAVRLQVGEVLEEFMEETGTEFGAVIHYSVVYGMIDVLPSVSRVKSLGLDAQGMGIKRTRNGNLILPANGLAYLKDWTCAVSPDR